MSPWIRLIGVNCVIVGVPLAPALAQDETPMEWFARMDRNGDDRIGRHEENAPRFAELDTERDGYVTLDVFNAYLAGAADRELDKNGDGRSTSEEENAVGSDCERCRLAMPLGLRRTRANWVSARPCGPPQGAIECLACDPEGWG